VNEYAPIWHQRLEESGFLGVGQFVQSGGGICRSVTVRLMPSS
jgi:hypothetical protein